MITPNPSPVPPPRLELRVAVPRWQRILSWSLCGLFVLAASVAAWGDWTRGIRGAALWLPWSVRLAQGLLLQQVVWKLEAKVLRVESGLLTVTTRFRRPFGPPRFVVPICEAALEWVGGTLILQTPETGGGLRLGFAPAARATADWLVALGAPPPVGG